MPQDTVKGDENCQAQPNKEGDKYSKTAPFSNHGGGDIKEVIDIIGDFGRFQRNIFLMFFFGCMVPCWHHLVMAFLAPNIDYWCRRPEGYESLSSSQWKNISTPPAYRDGNKRKLGQCVKYDFQNLSLEGILQYGVPNDTRQVECDQWEYDLTFYTSTVMSKWNVVCKDEWRISMTQSGYMLGLLTAVLVFGHAADKIGRRKIMLLAILFLLFSGLSCSFSQSLVQFGISRYFSGMGSAGFYVTGFVLVLEPVGPEYRTIMGMVVNFGWCIGYIMLPGIAYLLRDRMYIHLAITLPSLILCSYFWFLPESPRWLLTHGKMDEAEKLLRRAAIMNGKDTADLRIKIKKLQESYKQAAEKTKHTKKITVLDLFKTPNLRKKTLILYFSWFVNSFIYYGLSLNTNELGGNPFISFFIAGAVEFPSHGLSLLFIKRFGRRIPETTAMVIGGIACILTIPIPDELLWIRVSLAMFGKFCVTASYAINYLYTAELYPTVARNIGVGSSSMCARIGGILAPFVKELGRATHHSVPLTVFGGLSITSGLLILLLPETNKMAIPDTLEEAEMFGKKIPEKKLDLAGNNRKVQLSYL